jgi:hypothetical protein
MTSPCACTIFFGKIRRPTAPSPRRAPLSAPPDPRPPEIPPSPVRDPSAAPVTDPSPRAHHLLTVWNPSYSDSAMDAHLEVLLGWADRRAEGEGREDGDEEDRAYVWWAKIRSPNRLQPLPHTAEILALQEQIDAGVETQLYLTDYRSLYVARLEEVTDDDVPADAEGELDHMPTYYRGQAADFWFRVTDIRLLVADDTVATIEELKKLRNTRYHDRPVSLYGGMTELPLIVWREDGKTWFADSEPLTEGRLWAERDAELRGEVERMARELRENLLGREVWAVLEPSTRTFLAAAEAVFRARSEDPRFDFSGPALSYAKAVETELNALIFPLLRRALSRAPVHEREVRVDGRPLDLGRPVPHQTLGALRTLLQHDDTVQKHLRATLQHDAGWLLSILPNELRQLENLRNPAAHSDAARREEVRRARGRVLGIGGEGLVVRMAGARMRAG